MFRAPGEQGAEEKYTLSDALAVAVWLNVFIRQAKHVGMANIAQSVNVISPLTTHREGLVRQTTWWPLLLFSRYMRRGKVLAVNLRCGVYEGSTKPGWIRGTVDIPWLDVSATVDDEEGEGMVNLAVVNIHPEKDIKTKLDVSVADASGVEPKAKVYTVTGESVSSTNAEGSTEEVCIQESVWDMGCGWYTFPKHSFTLLRWRVVE